MLKFFLGLVIGGVGAALYWSEETRDRVGQRLATAPEPVRQSVASVASSTASGAQRVASAIQSSPLPEQVKDRARPLTASVHSAADNLRQQAGGSPAGQPASGPSVTGVPEDVRAEQDAAARAAADAQRQLQTGG